MRGLLYQPSMLKTYLRLAPFVLGLLMGIQAPAFVDQFAKTVSVHLSEARLNFSEFNKIAETYFGGNVEKLILHHRRSEDSIFRMEGEAIAGIYRRIAVLEAELAAVSGYRPQALVHIFFYADPYLFDEVRSKYSYVIPLDSEAVIWGLIIGFICSFTLEALIWLLRALRRVVLTPLT